MTEYSTNLPRMPQSLSDACRAQSLTTRADAPLAAKLVIWEASDKPTGALGEQQVMQLIEQIRTGGRLLLTTQQIAGLAPVQLGSILPSTGWGTQLRVSSFLLNQPFSIGQVDTAFFASDLSGLSIPFCHDIRPTSAVERGQASYERYTFVDPWLKTPVAAQSDTWSRSLLNREWLVRACLRDVAQTPFVSTSRYGAGKVVMVGTSADAIGDANAGQRFWTSILLWLLQEETVSLVTTKPEMQVSLVQGYARVALRNPSAQVLPVQIVCRVLAENGAILADSSAETLQSVQIPGGNSSTVIIPLPGRSPISDEAAGADRQLQVRIGALSEGGETLLAEQRLTTPPQELQLSIETENLYGVTYPFSAPGPAALGGFQGRMGAYVGAYAYPPGHAVRGRIILSNGLTNLAPHSAVRDLTSADNPSVMALNDRATGMRLGPSPDKIDGYAMWTGKKGIENVLEFTLPPNSQIAALVLVGSYGPYGNGETHNPGQVVIEADGRSITSVDTLDQAFREAYGKVRIPFPCCAASQLKIRLPWMQKGTPRDRQEPWLGEIVIEGWREQPAGSRAGPCALTLVNALSGDRQPILSNTVRVDSCGWQQIPFEVMPAQLEGTQIYRLEATFEHVTATMPIMAIAPASALRPLTEVRPLNGPGVGLNVSRGFREVSPIGTGTAEQLPGWAMPDDLVWAYSRQLKRVAATARTEAARLYVTETDMRHYITPWRSFSNGDLFLPTIAPGIVEGLRKGPRWSTSETVLLMFADGWETGPDLRTLHAWPDYVEFDKWLRASGQAGLRGRTLAEVSAEIEANYKDSWQAWQLARYVQSIRALRESFQSAGKSLVISAQGVPMVAGDAGRELALTIRGSSDDSTWSMLDNSTILTTGRQMSELAFNPVWQMSTLCAWGFNSSLFNNWQWHNPVGTPEPSRRHIYDRAWRATIWAGGRYASLYTYGFASNVGTAFNMTENDFQQWWYLQERHSLLAPESPLGAGLVISTRNAAAPEHIRFDCGDPLELNEARLLALAFRNLHNAGISLPFAANAGSLKDWNGTAPLILLNLADFSSDEIRALSTLHARGTRLAAFAERSALSADATALFLQPGTLLLEGSAATLTPDQALAAAAVLHRSLDLPLSFPDGTAGYGFRSQGLSYIVIEDWLEQARYVTLRVTKTRSARTARACNLNDHQTVIVQSDGESWKIQVPLRSGDGILIALKES